jgi:hypothetical protein
MQAAHVWQKLWKICHRKRVNRFLLRERYEPKDLFEEVKLYVNVVFNAHHHISVNA